MMKLLLQLHNISNILCSSESRLLLHGGEKNLDYRMRIACILLPLLKTLEELDSSYSSLACV